MKKHKPQNHKHSSQIQLNNSYYVSTNSLCDISSEDESTIKQNNTAYVSMSSVCDMSSEDESTTKQNETSYILMNSLRDISIIEELFDIEQDDMSKNSNLLPNDESDDIAYLSNLFDTPHTDSSVDNLSELWDKLPCLQEQSGIYETENYMLESSLHGMSIEDESFLIKQNETAYVSTNSLRDISTENQSFETKQNETAYISMNSLRDISIAEELLDIKQDDMFKNSDLLLNESTAYLTDSLYVSNTYSSIDNLSELWDKLPCLQEQSGIYEMENKIFVPEVDVSGIDSFSY